MPHYLVVVNNEVEGQVESINPEEAVIKAGAAGAVSVESSIVKVFALAHGPAGNAQVYIEDDLTL